MCPVPSSYPPRILIAAFVLCVPSLRSAPPELTPLQDHYASAVITPFETGKSALQSKYGAALESAAKTAQQAGMLEEVLALTQERKRLADGLPIPEAEDDAPDSLKKLRAIYHGQLARLTAEREASRAKLLPVHTEKLKELETALTKAGRIPDALEVKTYREGLAIAPVPVAPPPVTMPPATTAQVPVPRIKGDDRKAAEWILANWKEHRIFAGNKLITDPTDLPPGRFHLTSIAISGDHYTGAMPLDGDALLQHLGGLELVDSLKLDNFPPLTDGDFTFIATLESLATLGLDETRGITDAMVDHLVGLRKLKALSVSKCPGFTGAKLGLLTNLPLEGLGFFNSKVNDAGLAGIANFRRLEFLDLSGTKTVTDASLSTFRSLPGLKRLHIGATGITPVALASAPMPGITHLGCNEISGESLKEIAPRVAPAFPNLIRFDLTYNVRTPEDLAALAHFKKLRAVSHGGNVEDTAWPGLLELRDLESFTNYREATPLPAAALTTLVQVKKLKRIDTGSVPPAPADLAAFKAARPDVEITK